MRILRFGLAILTIVLSSDVWGQFAMDPNDPRSNGNGGWASSAYSLNDNDRSAHDQGINNRHGWTDERHADYVANGGYVDKTHRKSLGMSSSSSVNDHRNARERIRTAAEKQRIRQKKDDSKERRQERARIALEEAEAAARAAAEEHSRFEDPWAPYKEPNYTCGELGNCEDYAVHQEAYDEARAIADQCTSCSESAWVGTPQEISTRRALLNAIYTREIYEGYENRSIPEQDRAVPAGPMAAAAKYVEGRDPEPWEHGIDQLIRTGEVAYYYPRQTNLGQSQTVTETQKLGQESTIVLVASDQDAFNGINALRGGISTNSGTVESLAGYSSEGIYPGGLVVINNSNIPEHPNGGQLYVDYPNSYGEKVLPVLNPNNHRQLTYTRHEFSHAGERAIVNLTAARKQAGQPVSDVIEQGARVARASVLENQTYIINNSSESQYVNEVTEVEAYLTSDDNEARAKLDLANRYVQRYNMDLATAYKTVELIANSPLRLSIRHDLDAAASELRNQ